MGCLTSGLPTPQTQFQVHSHQLQGLQVSSACSNVDHPWAEWNVGENINECPIFNWINPPHGVRVCFPSFSDGLLHQRTQGDLCEGSWELWDLSAEGCAFALTCLGIFLDRPLDMVRAQTSTFDSRGARTRSHFL